MHNPTLSFLGREFPAGLMNILAYGTRQPAQRPLPPRRLTPQLEAMTNEFWVAFKFVNMLMVASVVAWVVADKGIRFAVRQSSKPHGKRTCMALGCVMGIVVGLADWRAAMPSTSLLTILGVAIPAVVISKFLDTVRAMGREDALSHDPFYRGPLYHDPLYRDILYCSRRGGEEDNFLENHYPLGSKMSRPSSTHLPLGALDEEWEPVHKTPLQEDKTNHGSSQSMTPRNNSPPPLPPRFAFGQREEDLFELIRKKCVSRPVRTPSPLRSVSTLDMAEPQPDDPISNPQLVFPAPSELKMQAIVQEVEIDGESDGFLSTHQDDQEVDSGGSNHTSDFERLLPEEDGSSSNDEDGWYVENGSAADEDEEALLDNHQLTPDDDAGDTQPGEDAVYGEVERPEEDTFHQNNMLEFGSLQDLLEAEANQEAPVAGDHHIAGQELEKAALAQETLEATGTALEAGALGRHRRPQRPGWKGGLPTYRVQV